MGFAGAFALARRDPNGLALIDGSAHGALRSFWVALLVAPAYVAMDLLAGGWDQDYDLRRIVIQIIAYVIDWAAFPLVMAGVADSLGRGGYYTRYVAVYNWSALVQMSFLLPAAALAVAFPSPASVLLAQGVGIVMLVYRAYVAHVALAAPALVCAGIVLLDLLLAMVLKLVTMGLLGR